MSILDGLLGNWIQIVDIKNEITIENFDYSTGVIKGKTGNHCVKCVAVNKCWFKNENGKKPSAFEVTKVKLLNDILNGLTPGLYHYNCHCQETTIITPDINNIQLIIPSGKIDWLFLDKSTWVHAMGYDSDIKFINLLENLIKQAYCYGLYRVQSHNNYGFKINLLIDVPGVNEKTGKFYKIKSNFMVFPNGKLKCNTLIGGWQ